MRVTVVEKPSIEGSNIHYCTNRPPLLASPLVKLPLGSVRAEGWLKHQLELMINGLAGRLKEIT